MRATRIAVAALVALAAASPGVVAGNEPPLVDAGLDQRVDRGATVFLDGTGSVDADGRIAARAWTILTPDGREAAPVAPAAGRTRFVARDRGTYAVTLTAADDAGARSADTLYVRVGPDERARASDPSVRVEGPSAVPAGASAEFRAVGAFDRVAWATNRSGVRIDERGPNASLTFDAPPGTTVAVRARADDDGGAETATRRVRVVEPRRDDPARGGLSIDEFAASPVGADGDAFATPVAVRNGTAAVRFRAAASGDRAPTYEWRFENGTVNRTVGRWEAATLVREFSFADGAFDGGTATRNATLFVREEGWRYAGGYDEATRTVEFRRAGGTDASDGTDGDGAADPDGRTGGGGTPPTAPFGPVVGIRK